MYANTWESEKKGHKKTIMFHTEGLKCVRDIEVREGFLERMPLNGP